MEGPVAIGAGAVASGRLLEEWMVLDAYHVLLSLAVFCAGVYAVFLALFFFGARRVVRTDAPTDPALVGSSRARPPVTILKPCAGADDELDRCLESYCALDYPSFQIVFGVRDAGDAAYPIVQRVKARHPELDIAVVLSGEGRHPSPKVCNLEAMSAHTKHALVWLSDSNTRVHPQTLTAMVDDLEQPGVGLVVSPIVGDDERTTGSMLESLQLTAYIAKWTYIIHGITKLMIAPGKSSLLRRETLDAIGGWDELGKYFGEDFILFERVRARGLQVALGRHLVTNVSIHSTVKKFLSRHLRWVQIRWRVTPTTFLEPLLAPILPALLFAVVAPSALSAAILAGTALEQLVGDAVILRRLRGHGMAWGLMPAVLLRPVLATWLWARATVDKHVEWRGNHFWMGPQSTLLRDPPLRTRLLRAARNAIR